MRHLQAICQRLGRLLLLSMHFARFGHLVLLLGTVSLLQLWSGEVSGWSLCVLCCCKRAGEGFINTEGQMVLRVCLIRLQ
jgi:hypothetical protein